MIRITILVGGEADASGTICAADTREAVAIAQARHPKQEIRVAYPTDPEAFFIEQ